MRQLESVKRFLQLILSCIGQVLQILIYAYFYFKYFAYAIELNFAKKGPLLIIALYAFMLLCFSAMYGGMRIGYLRPSEVIFSQIMSTVIVNIITYAQISLMCRCLLKYKSYWYMFSIQLVVATLWIIVANGIYRRVFPPRQLLLVHGDRPIDDIVKKFESREDKYVIAKTMNIKEGVEKVCLEALERYDAVVIWDIPSAERNNVLKFCYGKGIRVYIMPKISDVILAGAEQLHIFDTPILLTREYSLRLEERFIKRFFDILLSLILIIISSPFMLVTAVAVKMYDGGPVLYKQVRCTIDARQFKILKFRSMRVDAEKDGVARLAKANDDRITPVGKIIRKCRLDELPQLFNIFVGDMSFIGPRPERPEIIAQYMDSMPEFAFRMKVKAGLAGYAQVYGKYNTTPYDKLKLDLCYIENYSIWLDVKLMLLTIKILFWPDSTEGVSDNQVTALKEESAEERND